MYRQVIVPTEREHSVVLPKEFYGLKVEVLAFPIEEKRSIANENMVDPDAFYGSIKLNFSNFKFNRDEANQR
jgi:hypothetical protein